MKPKKYKNIKGRLQATWLTFKFSNTSFLALTVLLITFLDGTIELIFFDDGIKELSLKIIIFSISTLITLFSYLMNIINFHKDTYYFRSVYDPVSSFKKQQSLSLNNLYIENGYKVYPFTSYNSNECMLMSNLVNASFFKANRIDFKLSKLVHDIPNEVRPFVPYALKDRLKSRTYLVNDTLLALDSDFLINTKKINLKKAKYFSFLTTNRLAYKKIIHTSKTNLVFDSDKLLLDSNKNFVNIKDSYMSNVIGVNTLAISNDNYLIIHIQGKRSEVSQEKYINSGSGSLSPFDIKKDTNFKKVLARGATRELIEECGLPKKTKINTKMIGLMRVLASGGNPDFFGVSRVDLTKDEILHYAKNAKEVKQKIMNVPVFKKIDKDRIEESIINILDELISDSKKESYNENGVSIQLYTSYEILKNHLINNIEPFNYLEKDSDYIN